MPNHTEEHDSDNVYDKPVIKLLSYLARYAAGSEGTIPKPKIAHHQKPVKGTYRDLTAGEIRNVSYLRCDNTEQQE
jgi:hypothetical protein